MACCGRSRAAKTKNAKVSTKMVLIEYIGTKDLTVFSTFSMRSYTFSPTSSQRVQRVNAQEAELFLRKRNFQRYTNDNRQKS